MAHSAIMNVMVQAATKAGRSLTRDFGEVQNLQVSIKGPGDFVSEADKRAEKVIRQELHKARPDYSMLLEEGGEVLAPDRTNRWIVDPLDGTTNFLHSIPYFAVSIALERQGEIVAGVIYNPIQEELFTAEKGQGAFFNNRRMRVAARTSLTNCVLATGIPHRGKKGHARPLLEVREVVTEVSGLRGTGSAALDLASVAAGRLDGYWEYELNAWDIAAGIIMVRESGGFVNETDGGSKVLETGNICAANEAINKKLRALLKNADKKLADAKA